MNYFLTEEQIWATIADWDQYDEVTRQNIREEYPQVRWDLTVDWTRVGDDLRESMGVPRIIKAKPQQRRWWWPF